MILYGTFEVIVNQQPIGFLCPRCTLLVSEVGPTGTCYYCDRDFTRVIPDHYKVGHRLDELVGVAEEVTVRKQARDGSTDGDVPLGYGHTEPLLTYQLSPPFP